MFYSLARSLLTLLCFRTHPPCCCCCVPHAVFPTPSGQPSTKGWPHLHIRPWNQARSSSRGVSHDAGLLNAAVSRPAATLALAVAPKPCIWRREVPYGPSFALQIHLSSKLDVATGYQLVSASRPAMHICTFTECLSMLTASCLVSSQATVEEDLAAAVWWKSEAAPTTNSARNSDVQQFWSTNKGHTGDALKGLTGVVTQTDNAAGTTAAAVLLMQMQHSAACGGCCAGGFSTGTCVCDGSQTAVSPANNSSSARMDLDKQQRLAAPSEQPCLHCVPCVCVAQARTLPVQ